MSAVDDGQGGFTVGPSEPHTEPAKRPMEYVHDLIDKTVEMVADLNQTVEGRFPGDSIKVDPEVTIHVHTGSRTQADWDLIRGAAEETFGCVGTENENQGTRWLQWRVGTSRVAIFYPYILKEESADARS